jgi:hypothetical protein
MTAEEGARNRTYSLLLADTVVVTADGAPAEVCTVAKSALSDISYEINEVGCVALRVALQHIEAPQKPCCASAHVAAWRSLQPALRLTPLPAAVLHARRSLMSQHTLGWGPALPELAQPALRRPVVRLTSVWTTRS